MSAYEVAIDHIGYLVNLGQQLDIRGIHVEDTYWSLALDDEYDRGRVATELITQNRISVEYRYRPLPGTQPSTDHDEASDSEVRTGPDTAVDTVTKAPKFRGPQTPLTELAHYAQALQWVSCYSYQACEDPGWPNSFAFAYLDRVGGELDRKIIDCFPTTWDYSGPVLTIPART